MKVIAFGSCMSNITAAYLKDEYGFRQTHSVHHNRSDNFIRYFIDKTSDMIPISFFENLLIYKPDTSHEAREFLQNQYRDYVGFHGLQDIRRPIEGPFFADIAENNYDVILLDNYMDIASLLMRHRTIPEFRESPLFINPGFYENGDVVIDQFDWYDGYLTPEQSAQNWLKIYRWLRIHQPTAKIFFLTYHSCSSTSVPERYWRAFNFYPALTKIAADEDLHIVPPLSVAEDLTEGQINWPHFKMPVYRALAGYVFLHTVGGWSKREVAHTPTPLLDSP